MRIALVTCERPIERDRDFDFLAPALRRRDAEVDAPAWTDAGVDWSAYDVALVSSTWDYHERVPAFRRWLKKANRLTRLLNPLATIEWNLDKRYLRELDESGVPTIPTLWTEPGGEREAAAEASALGWDDMVIKPAIDLGAMRLARAGPEHVELLLKAIGEPALVQPFLPSLPREGELSVLFVDGEPAHALVKTPARGDFRVQPQYGGTHHAVDAPPEAVAIGRMALEGAPGEALYARVDLVRGGGDDLQLIELELIEPCLYLDVAPASGETLARAILAVARAPV